MENIIHNEKTSNKKLIINILFNIIIPVLILTKLCSDDYLGPVIGLIAALVFPLSYGAYDFIIKKKKNLIAILGFVSVLLTGIVGLMKFPPEMIAVKEALIPFSIGLINLISINTDLPLIKIFIYNKELIDVERIEKTLNENGTKLHFEKALAKASVFLSGSFFISAILNYVLAKLVVDGVPGTMEFNADLARMTLLTFPVIVIPTMIITGLIFWYLFKTIKKLSGLQTEEIFSENIRVALKDTE